MTTATQPLTTDRRPSEGLGELPSGWVWAKLGAVLSHIEAGRSPKNQGRPARDGEFGVLKVSAVSWGEFLAEENKALLPGDTAEPELTVRSGDLLISRANTSELIAAVVYVEHDHPKLMLSDKTLRLVPASPDISAKYLLYALRTPQARDFFGKNATGTSDSMRNISQEKIREVPIPLPPPAEQRRIVDRVETLLAQARTAREALAPLPTLVKRLRQSVLAAAFSGRLSQPEPGDEPVAELLERIRTERALLGGRKGRAEERALPNGLPELPEGWAWALIGDIFDVTIGGTPPRKEPSYWDGDIPWVSSGEVAFRRISHTRERITALGIENSNAKVLPIGTVLLGMIGEGKTRGQAAILDMPAASNQNAAALLCAATPIQPEWLFYWFMASYEQSRGGGVGGAQAALNSERIRQFAFPLAPLAEQRRIVARVEALLAQADLIEAAAQAASGRIADMEQAVLARAFRGELVEQEPVDSVLVGTANSAATDTGSA